MVVDLDGRCVGRIGEIYVDRTTQQPRYAAVRVGTEGRQHLVPLTGAQAQGHQVHVPISRDVIEDAPQLTGGTTLGAREQRLLCAYYAFDWRQDPERGDGVLEPLDL